MKRTLLALLLIVAAAYAYDGPLVTPAPSVRPGPTVLVTWDIRSFAERSYPPQSRPTHVFYEVSRDSSFRRDARVASGGDLPLKGKVALDTRRWAPGEYFVRIVAKRGGNTPQHDVARRSSAVRFSVGSAQALTSLRIDPPSAPIDVPEGRTRFRAILSEGQGEIDWSVEGGNTYGKIIPDFEDSSRATLVAPEQLPPGTTRIRIRARLRSDPSVAASAEAHVRYRVEPVTGTPTPQPVGPQPSPTASPPSGRLPGADNVVQVSAFTVTPEQPVQGFHYTLFLSIRNRSGQNLTGVKWKVLGEGTMLIDEGTTVLSRGSTARIPIEIRGELASAYGTRYYQAVVDAENLLGESELDRGDNQRDLWVEVQPAQTVVKDLSFEEAAAAGARFRANFFSEDLRSVSEEPWNKQIYGGVFGSYPTPATWFLVSASGTAIFELNGRAPLGTIAARPEAFLDFTLKNGWVVDSVETGDGRSDEVGNGLVRWLVTPEPGSRSCYTRLRLELEHTPGQVTAFIRIKIRGPSTLSPYK